MQFIVFARSSSWAQVEELLLDEWDALFTEVLQAKPTAWNENIETHRIGYVTIPRADARLLQEQIAPLNGSIFPVPKNESIAVQMDSFLEQRSLHLRS